MPALLVLLSVGALGLFWYVAAVRDFTSLESFFWQLFGISFGFAGSVWGGRKSISGKSREISKPSARSAFRRLRSLYLSFSQVAHNIEAAKNSDTYEKYRDSFAEIRGIVFMQLATADDAMEEWKDIVPEDVEELYHELSADYEIGDIR